jgi:hypothetical protein
MLEIQRTEYFDDYTVRVQQLSAFKLGKTQELE